MSERAPWITYRPEIKVLDATIRDGGLINNHKFEDEFVRDTYQTCLDAGVDYMEIGYKCSKDIFSPDQFGPWKFCDEADIRRVIGDNDSPLKISVMADAGGKCDYKKDILPREESVIDMIRVACYVHQISDAVDMIHDAHEKGYEVTCNIMAVSTAQDAEIDQALQEAAKTPIKAVCVVDSFGSLYSEQIAMLVKRYKAAMEGTNIQISVHAHNNQQLAFANTIEAIIQGANYIDATMGGMGRGAGNCPMELLMGFLRNPKFRIRPVWALLQKWMPILQQQMEWGPYAPYIISGQLNQHPRSSIAWQGSEQKANCRDYYDKIIADI
jgi:4-hydroxy 2-oxovalerate aldolase